jgi:mRNA interferase RelE/StbE
MSYEVILSSKSYNQLKSFNAQLKARLKKATLEIGEDPWHKGTIKVEGHENVRRKRVGKHRLLYTVDKQRKEVLIIKIELRNESTYKL